MRENKLISCEVCSNVLEGPIIDLGSHPLCDDLVLPNSNREVPIWHQEIKLCSICLTAHQMHPVEKELLFKPDYHYRSNLTKDVLDGMRDFAMEMGKFVDLNPGDYVLDVGCNDGSLLRIFNEIFDVKVVGIDPTDAILESSLPENSRYKSFFDQDAVQRILKDHGKPKLITFTNVFAHIEDLPNLLNNLLGLIDTGTHVAIENHYLGSILDKNQFDTFYHEHPRTYSAKSFTYIARSLGMSISKLSLAPRYGGNIRALISPEDWATHAIPAVDESNFLEKFAAMQSVYDNWLTHSKGEVERLSKSGLLAGKSLPGRAVMLINSLKIDKYVMKYIFEKDASPKVGYLCPSTDIEILPDSELLLKAPDILIVWAWHIADEVVEYLLKLGFEGEIWIPLPEFRRIV